MVRVVSHLFAECVNVNYFYLSFTIIAAFSLLSLKSSSQLIQSKMIDNLQLLSLSFFSPGETVSMNSLVLRSLSLRRFHDVNFAKDLGFYSVDFTSNFMVIQTKTYASCVSTLLKSISD